MAHTPAGHQIERLQEILDSVLESPNAQVPVDLELEQQWTDGNMLPVENVDMGHDFELMGFGHVEGQLVAGPGHLLIKVRVTSTELRLLFGKAFVAYPGELVHSCVFMKADSSMIFFFYPAMLASSWESAEVWRAHMCSIKSLMEVITSFWRQLADLHGKGISPGPVELADIVINKSRKISARFINMKKLTNFSASQASQDIIDGAKVMLQLLLPGHFTNTWPFTPTGWEKYEKNLPPQLVHILRLASTGEKSAEHIWIFCGQAEKLFSEHGVQCTDANPTAVADDRCLAPPVLVSDIQESPVIDGRYVTPPVSCSERQESLATEPSASHEASFTRPSVMNQCEDKGFNCKLVAGGIHDGAFTIPAPAVRSDLSNINFNEEQSYMAESHISGLNSLTNQKNIRFDRNVIYVTNDTALISQADSEAISLNPQQANGNRKASGNPSRQTSGLGTMSTFDSHDAHFKGHQRNSHQSNTARQHKSMPGASVGRFDNGPTSEGAQPKNGTAADEGEIESGPKFGGARPKNGTAADVGGIESGPKFGGARPKNGTAAGQGRSSNGQTSGRWRLKGGTTPGQGRPGNGQTFGGARPKDRTALGQCRPSNGQTSGRWRQKGGTPADVGGIESVPTFGGARPKDRAAPRQGRWRPKGGTATGEVRLGKRPKSGRWRPKDGTAASNFAPHKNKPDTITDYMEHISKRKSGCNTRHGHTSSSSEDED